MNLIEELRYRNLFDNCTHEAAHELANEGKAIFYAGFDPTADSYHVGHLAVFNQMKTLQKHGNKPIGLMGGGTGMIGDPSGKSAERNLLDGGEIERNVQKCRKQMEAFLSFDGDNKAILVNNQDWLSEIRLIDFLRDIGKHFSVNRMISRESVSKRLTTKGDGISYTEFSYMALQAYDFYHLNLKHGCNMQLGGSDQWGNIVSGIDLIRRLSGREAYGLTMPLITKSDGTKFGKTESGTIWLDPAKTSPFQFYQHFLRTEDADVVKMLKCMTQLEPEAIEDARSSVENHPEGRDAQRLLAESLTEIAHGKKALDLALKATRVLFGGSLKGVSSEEIEEIFKEVPSAGFSFSDLERGLPMIDAFVAATACKSKGEARKLADSKGAYVNNVLRVGSESVLTQDDLITERHAVLRKGKKNYFLLRFQ